MKGGVILLGWMVVRALAQGLLVILLARALGGKAYGQFVAIVAICSLVLPFVGLGLSQIILRNSARDPKAKHIYLGDAIRGWLWTLPLGIIAAAICASNALPGANLGWAITLVALGELGAVSMTDIGVRHWQAQQRTSVYGALSASLPITRLVALALFFSISQGSKIESALVMYGISSIIHAMGVLFLLHRETVLHESEKSTRWFNFSGSSFSFAILASKIQAEFNKPVLARQSPESAGDYNIAQRSLDLISLPILVLQEIVWPKLFSLPNPTRPLSALSVLLLSACIGVAILVWGIAPLIPKLLGSDYSGVVAVVQMLAWLPVFQVVRAILNFSAIYAEKMRLVAISSTLGAVASVVGVAVLVPHYGVNGAVTMSYFSEFLIICAFAIGLYRRRKRI